MPPKSKKEKPVKSGKGTPTVPSARDGDALTSEAEALVNEGIVTTFALSTKKIHRNVRDISVSNLTVTFHGEPLVEEAELSLNYGNRYGYLGRNGCGKTTFMRVIAARSFPMPEGIDIFHVREEIEASDMTAMEAVMSVDKERTKLEAEAEELNDFIAAEDGSEEADSAMERLTQVYERLEELDSATAETRASKILDGLGFSPAKQNKKTREFSGGWRMRIALARALFLQPTLLLLDEPTNHLDMEAVVWLEDYLSKWKKILLVVSHSQDFLNGVCTHIVYHTKKRLLYFSGNYDSFIKTREEKEEEQEKRYKAEQDQIKHMKNYVARFGNGNAKMARQAQSKEKILDKMLRSGLTEKVEHEKDMDFKFPDPAPLAPPVLQCTDISFGYPNCALLYANVNLAIDLDSRVALVGPNGAGKSTLLKIMTGELIPVLGAVRPHPHLRISKFSQHFVDVLDLNLSPLDYFLTTWPDMTRDDGRRFLGRFGITGTVQTQKMAHLSDGQKSRVVLAKMAKETPHILFLDEPTNHLDMESIDSLARAINQFTGGMVLVSHDMRLISQVAKEIWLCDHKTVARFPGDIRDFKMHLKQQIQESAGEVLKRNAVGDAIVAGSASTDASSGAVKKPAASSSGGISVAKKAPASAAASASTSTASASASAASSSKSLAQRLGNDEDPDNEDGEGGEKEDKAAMKARKKAEKEAAMERERLEEEERIRRREEKARDIEAARELAAKERRMREEAEEEKRRKAQEEEEAERERERQEAAQREQKKQEKRLEKERRRNMKALVQQLEVQVFERQVLQEVWTQEQQEALEQALLRFPPDSGGLTRVQRWTQIAQEVGGGKTRTQCLARVKFLRDWVQAQNAQTSQA